MSVHKYGTINKQSLIFLYVGVYYIIIQQTINWYIIIYYHQKDKNIKINIYISLNNYIKNHQKINNEWNLLINIHQSDEDACYSVNSSSSSSSSLIRLMLLCSDKSGSSIHNYS